VHIQVDGGRTLAIPTTEPQHLDYGYAITSHSSQGQTAERVLVHVETERIGEQLVNRRLAYVAISRGRYDAQIYTNDKTQLGEALSRDVSHRSALRMGGAERSHASAPPARQHTVEVTVAREGHGR
jgi:ATP-dependent exoDNAse (exonuclease V) alpha subunit